MHDDVADGEAPAMDFGVVARRMEEENAAAAVRLAPPRSDPFLRSELCRIDEDQFDPTRPVAYDEGLAEPIDGEDLEWAAWTGLRSMRRFNEGAVFLRLAEDVYLITVMGAQPMHHDRHVVDEPFAGFSEHTWNIIAEPSDDQLLLCEVAECVYEHFPLTRDAFIYMNTSNRHAVTRRSPDSTVVLVQVDGYGPDEPERALARLREVLAARPAPSEVTG